MKTRRALQITLAFEAMLGTVMLGQGQGSTVLPLMAIGVAVTSVCVTDIGGWFRINTTIANLLAIGAVSYSVWEFLRLPPNQRLLAVANLLAYLQFILLYQKKNTRIFWQLLSMSLLQVMVASALREDALLGLMLFLYLVAGLLGLGLLFFYSEIQKHGRFDDRSGGDSVRSNRKPVRVSLRAVSDPAIVPIQFSISSLPPLRRLRGELLANLLFVATLVVMIGASVFVLVPRHRPQAWHIGPQSTEAQAGFSGNIDLNASEQTIYLDDTIVMRVTFRDPETDVAIQLNDEPYFRGGVMTRYERRSTRPLDPNRNWLPPVKNWDEPSAPSETEHIVNQQIVLEPMFKPHMFSVYPFLRSTDSRIAYHPLHRTDYNKALTDTYLLQTSGIYRERMHPLVPCTYVMQARRLARIDKLPRDTGRTKDSLANIKSICEKLLADSDIPADDVVERAFLLERHFLSSNLYSYSLEQPQRDPKIDPIEDFLTNNPSGHCEIFASALALMLRSQGIPSRIVGGYHGGEWNPIGKYYQVRQLHAHAWVEAYLTPDQIPEDLKIPGEDYSRGAWLRLDPTPGDSDGLAQQDTNSLWLRIKNIYDNVEMLWQQHVASFNRNRQRELVVEPLVSNASRWIGDTWGFFERLVHAVIGKFGLSDTSVGDTLVRILAFVMFAMVAALILLCNLAAFVWIPRRIKKIRRRNARLAKRRPTQVEFYRRLEDLLARHGMCRAANQTQFEFAAMVGRTLAKRPGDHQIVNLTQRVADCFYRIRFGRKQLDAQQRESVEMAIRQLAVALNHSG